MPKSLALIPLIAFFLFLNLSFASAQDGKNLFKANCKSCHYLSDKMSTGPGLAGVSTRVPSKEWMMKWVTDNISLQKSGDPYAVQIKAKYGAQMTVFAGTLNQDQIKAIVDYVFSEPGEPVVVTNTGTNPNPTPGGNPEEGGISPFYLTLIIIAILLILVSALKSIRRNMQNTVNEKKGLPPMPEYNWRQWASHNKRSVALILIVVACYGSAQGWDALMGIGVYQGYKPTQPIKFSHKLHAGDNKIACEYCHSGVLKSKVAGVPTVNVCMNCHKGITSGPQYGETEINKIYAAAGWNKTTMKYDKAPTPLVWNKVHVLPDFVFFSHQQHVVVGKQECKNCHGDLTTMDVAKQFSPLTMGWCIECHSKTEVPGMKDNPYYEEFHKKLAEKYRGKSDSLITVARMGGIECAKCHY
jgi:mono/diheme cytochrome c family protein